MTIPSVQLKLKQDTTSPSAELLLVITGSEQLLQL